MNNHVCLAMIFLLSTLSSTAQLCSSDRYKSELFSSQVSQDIYFATADPYGLSSSQDLKLDIYEPIADSSSYRPLMVYVFGGAFLIGDKRQPDIPLICSHFAKQGFVVASIDYRIGFNTLSTGSSVRAVYRGIQDLRAAVRFLCENRSTYRIDTNFIFYSGSSAGCIAGVQSAYMTDADRPAYTYAGAVPLEPNDMGCADCSGNTLFGQRVPKPAGILNRWGAILDTAFITSAFEDSVPMISFHGTADPAVPYTSGSPFSFPVFPSVMGSSYIHQRLAHLNVYNVLVPLIGAGHEPELIEPRWDDTIIAYCTPFLYQILKPKTSAIVGPAAICLNDTAIYRVDYATGTNYCWMVDSGTTIISQVNNQLQVVFNSIAVHQISVVERNRINCYGDSIGFTVNVLSRPMADFSFSSTELNTSFTNLSTSASSNRWFFGDATSSTANSPNHIYADTGTFLVSLVADNGYCSDTLSKNCHVSRCPIASFAYTVDANAHLYLFNSSSYVDSLTWDFGDGDSSGLFNPTHTYLTAGTYKLILWVFNKARCVDSMAIDIQVNQANAIAIANDIEDAFYPNPAGNWIHINRAEKIDRMEIVNSYGQLVQKKILVDKDNILNIEHLEDGIYFIKLYSRNLVKIYKFCKQ